MRNFTLVERKDGRTLFISPPSKLGKDKEGNQKSYDVVSLERSANDALTQIVVPLYQDELEKRKTRKNNKICRGLPKERATLDPLRPATYTENPGAQIPEKGDAG